MSHDYLLSLADLADERAVVFYDQLDAGRSDRPNDPKNWVVARFLDEIKGLRNALDLPRIVVFGNSWGGTLAAAYAALRPAGLERLVLSSPLIATKRWITDNETHRIALPNDVVTVMKECEAGGRTDAPEYQAAVQIFYERHFCRLKPWPDNLLATFETLNLECYFGMWGPNEFSCSGILKDYDGTNGLALIEVPTLVTCGEFDEATPAACAHYASIIPRGEAVSFPNSSHLAFIEVPRAYIGRIRKFLAQG